MRVTIRAILAVLIVAGAGVCAAGGEPPPPDTNRPIIDRQIKDEGKAPPETGKDKDKVFTFGLFTGVQYDDNIILRNRHVPGESRTDWKSVNALYADGRLLDEPERATGLRYNLYQSIIDRHDELQLTGNSLTLYHAEFHAPVVVHLPASFSHYDLQQNEYLDLWSFAPAVFVEETPHLVGVLRGGLRGYDYASLPDNDFNDKDRSSLLAEVGAEQWLLFGDQGQYRLELGYTYRHEHANSSEWSNNQNEARLGARAALPLWDLSTEGALTYTDKAYSDRNELFGRTEREDIVTVGLSVSRPLTPWWESATVSLAWLYTADFSNEESQAYRRNQLTLGLAVEF